MDQVKALFGEFLEAGYTPKTSNNSKASGTKSDGLNSKDDAAADAAKAAADMDLRVDLYLQEKDEDYKFGGHTLMGVQSEWGLPELCDAISHKFKGDQKLPAVKRPNLAPESVWSDSHKVKKIASVSRDAVTTQWDSASIDKSWIFSEDNCTNLLRAMEQHRAPEALAIYISRAKYDDYIY